jgi:hypothetical protein
MADEVDMADLGDPSFNSSDLPRSFRAERNEALHHVLRKLPYDFIVAMIEGLEAADVITPGRLLSGDRGGCAVGVTLRALDPETFGGRWVMWGRSRSVRGFRRRLANRVPHLCALEQVFDRSVALAREAFPASPRGEVAKAVAAWVADEARAELILREMNSEWLDRIVERLASQPVRARARMVSSAPTTIGSSSRPAEPWSASNGRRWASAAAPSRVASVSAA